MLLRYFPALFDGICRGLFRDIWPGCIKTTIYKIETGPFKDSYTLFAIYRDTDCPLNEPEGMTRAVIYAGTFFCHDPCKMCSERYMLKGCRYDRHFASRFSYKTLESRWLRRREALLREMHTGDNLFRCFKERPHLNTLEWLSSYTLK